MAKKKFSSGLEDLFSDQNTITSGVFDSDTAASVQVVERKSAHKNFASDLEHLLREALEDAFGSDAELEPKQSIAKDKSKSTSSPSIYGERSGGLDALIRQTIDIQESAPDEITGKKRLTISLDRTKLDRLKTIAKLENAQIRDLMLTLIDGYIDEYIHKKGIELR